MGTHTTMFRESEPSPPSMGHLLGFKLFPLLNELTVDTYSCELGEGGSGEEKFALQIMPFLCLFTSNEPYRVPLKGMMNPAIISLPPLPPSPFHTEPNT